MSCPLFLPDAPLNALAAEAAPLGDFYAGHCAGDPGCVIPFETLRRCCNTGYARGACARAGQAEADAVRFLIKSDRSGVVEVAWASERNHHPVAVGSLQVGRQDVTGADETGGPLERQARACVGAYLRQQRT